jgi:hypothetical protein
MAKELSYILEYKHNLHVHKSSPLVPTRSSTTSIYDEFILFTSAQLRIGLRNCHFAVVIQQKYYIHSNYPKFEV